jgi:16S rRNA processing protein RimM
MEYLYVGKIVNTHGIKGEIRIFSNFDKKDLVFKPGMKLYFGDNKEEFTITSFRHHKEFEMVCLEGFNNINQVLQFMKMKVFVKKSDLNLSDGDYVLEELVGLNIVFNDTKIGKVCEIVYNSSNILLSVSAEKNFYIPNNPNFIKKVNLESEEIIVENIEGLML